MKICDYTCPELDRFRKMCNFTNDELQLFDLRSKDISVEKCAELMNTSISTTKRIHKRIWSKIERIESL